MRILIALFLLTLASFAQVPAVPDPTTGVPMQGRIAPQGNFPLLSGGAVQMPADADYTLVYPQFTGSVLRITSAVPLTATRNVIHNLPANQNQRFGFEFTVQNATSGGHDIVFKGSTGTGVTIPNGETRFIVFDGTNYVSPAGSVGTTPPPSEQGVVMARDLSDWGVKSDAAVAGDGCEERGTNGHTIGCWGDASFEAGRDEGKLIILYGAGPIDGRVIQDGTFRVVSGGHGGVDGLQPVVFNDPGDGCSSKADGSPDYANMPYMWVNVVGGVPTGVLYQNHSFFGDHCTRPPTKGTVLTVTGEVTFTGGYMAHGDLPTTITAVHNGWEVEVADNIVTKPWNGAAVFGTDDHDAFERACNDRWASHLTFSRAMIISHGVNCKRSNFWLEGQGYTSVGAKSRQTGQQEGSIIIYGGKGLDHPGMEHDWIIDLSEGYGAKISRMGFRGNSMARPYALMPSFGRPGSVGGGGIAQMYVFQELYIGWMWGDPAKTQTGYQLQSCIFTANVTGNGDFATADQIFCEGAEVGYDAMNGQAVDWEVGKWHSDFDNIGYACIGSPKVRNYYTEYNRLDIMGGSPTQRDGYCQSLRMEYGGESSTKQFETMSPQGSAASYDINVTGWGLGSPIGQINPDPNQIMVDARRVGGITWNGGITPGTKIALRRSCGGVGSYRSEINVPATAILWEADNSQICSNLEGTPFKNSVTQTDIQMTYKSPDNIGALDVYGKEKFYPLMRDDKWFIHMTGSLQAVSPIPPGEATGYNGTGQLAYIGGFADGARQLRQAIGTTETSLPFREAFSYALPGYVNSVIRIGNEFMEIKCPNNDWTNPACFDSYNPLVVRGHGGTQVATHQRGDVVSAVLLDERGKGVHGTFVGFLRQPVTTTDTTIHMAWALNGMELRIQDEYMTVTDENGSYDRVGVSRGARGSTPAAHGENYSVLRVDGNTIYHYQVTCSDAKGEETRVGKDGANLITIAINDRPTKLTPALSNVVGFWMHRGCAYYNLYGDEGSGEIGFLHTAVRSPVQGHNGINFPNFAFLDTGEWTKDTTRKPPTVSQSGIMDAEDGFRVNGKPLASTHLEDFSATLPTNGQVPKFNTALGKYVPGDAGSLSDVLAGLSGGRSGQNMIPNISTTGGGGHFGMNHEGSTGGSVWYGSTILAFAVESTAAGSITSIKIILGDTAYGQGRAALYDSNGPAVAGFSYGGAGTLLCSSSTDVAMEPHATLIFPVHCEVAANHHYYLAVHTNTQYGVAYIRPQNQDEEFAQCAVPSYWEGTFPAHMPAATDYHCYSSGPYNSVWPLWAEYSTTLGTNEPYSSSHPIPPATLGSGSTGDGSKCLRDNSTWEACGTGGGGEPLFTAGGDLSGTHTNQQVIGIGSHAIPTLSSGTHGYFYWNGTGLVLDTPATDGGGGNFTAGGDLSGTASSQQVTGIRGVYVEPITDTGVEKFLMFRPGTGNIWTPTVAISQFGGAEKVNSTYNGDYSQNWVWALHSSNYGMVFGEYEPATVIGGNLLTVRTLPESRVNPLRVYAHDLLDGLTVDWEGKVVATGNSKFIGNLQFPGAGLRGATSLATDPEGNVIPGNSAFSAGGDLSGTATNQQVTGIRGVVFPTGSNGYLQWKDGTGYLWANSIPMNALVGSATYSSVYNGDYTQTWHWSLHNATAGFFINEDAPSTGSGAMLKVDTEPTSTASPFVAIAHHLKGLWVNADGDVATTGGAKFIGPVQLPAALANQGSLGTDPDGNIIPGASGGGDGAVVTGTVTDVAPFEFGGGHLAKSGRLVNLSGHISLQASMPQNTPMAQIPANFRPSTDPTNPNYFGGIFDSGGNFVGFGLWNVTSGGQITWRGATVTPASGEIMVITAAWLQEE